MASRNAQTHAKRARELAVRERRERKRAKKAARRTAAAEESSGGPSTPTASETVDEHLGTTVGDQVTASGEIAAADPQAQATPTTEKRAVPMAGSDAKEDEHGFQ